MAGILIGAGALLSSHLSKRRKVEKEDKREYAQHFEQMKAENMRRESWRLRASQSTSYHSDRHEQSNDAAEIPSEAPPSYDDVTGERNGMGRRRSGERNDRGRPGRTGNDRTNIPLIDQTETQRSTNISPGQRIATRDMAVTH